MPSIVSGSTRPASALRTSRQIFTLSEIMTGVPQARASSNADTEVLLVRRKDVSVRSAHGGPFSFAVEGAGENDVLFDLQIPWIDALVI